MRFGRMEVHLAPFQRPENRRPIRPFQRPSGPITVVACPARAVEVLSPSDRSYDRTLERQRYMENGVTELWLVDADARTVEIRRAGEGEAETVADSIGWMVGERGYRVMLDDLFSS